jgi:hypothetical protein
MTIQIGELRARLTAESAQMKQEVQAVKKGIADLGEEGKRTSKSFDEMNASLSKVASNTDRLKTIDDQLKKMDPSKVEKGLAAIVEELKNMGKASEPAKKEISELDKLLKDVGLDSKQLKLVKDSLESINAKPLGQQLDELSEGLRKLGVNSQHIEKITKEMREAENETEKTKGGIDALASGIAALGAGAAMSKLISMTQTLAGEANQLASSYRGLSVVADKYNIDTELAVDLADKLADRWGLNKGMLADTVKTYTTMNLSLEDTERIITATADAAAYNRQSHLSWGEAIKQVAEGVKSGNSNLTDAAGITTNLSVMQDRYAKSIGTTAAKLTEAQKVQAAYNGMLEEGAIFAGNADDAMTGFTGTQASFQSTLQEARTELGEAFIPALEQVLDLITPLIKGFADWTEGNKLTTVGLAAASIAVTAFIALLGTLTAAFVVLNGVMGPIGWAILGIGSLVAGIGAYTVAVNAATASTERFNDILAKDPTERSVAEVKDMQAQVESLNGILNKRNEIMKEYNQRLKDAQEGRGSIENTHALFEIADEISDEVKALDKQLKELGYTAEEAEQAVKDMSKAIEQSTPVLREMRMEELREIAAKQDSIKESETLSQRYKELRENTKRTAEENGELTKVVRDLTTRYPDLHVEMDEQGQLLITNEGLLRDLITAEQDSVNAMLTAEAAKRKSLIRTTEASIKSAEAQIQALKAVAEADAPKSLPFLEDNTGFQWFSEGVHDKMPGVVTKAQEGLRHLTGLLSEYKVELNAIEDGTWVNLLGTKKEGGATTSGEEKGKGKAKTKAELEREAYQESLKLLDYKRNMDLLTEQQEVEALERIRKKYEHNAEIRMELEVRIHQLKKQMAADEDKRREEETKKTEQAARERFEHSSNWILQEERRMVLAGESEEAISKMKMEAWTRVRSRYAKDSDYYKQADTQLFNLRVELIRKTEKAEQEAARERETLAKDAVKRALDAIDKAKRAELYALDERRKAIQAFYDDQAEVIDDSERLKERNELVAEMDKYQHATSERGQKTFLELKEKLRLMDVEQQKRNLDKSREQELAALDRQKKDIESFYDDLRTATEDLTGDLSKLYKLVDDERLKSFKQTNELIKQEMAALQQALASYQSSISFPSSGGGGGGSSSVDASKIAQMQANSAAWHSANAAGKKQLSDDNKAIGASMGATYNSAEGKWYKNGVPLYHSGGIAGEMNFRSAYELAPDEINAILRRGEPVLTPDQVSSLVGAGQEQSKVIHHNYNAPLIENSGDVHLEDDADIESYHREQEHLVRQLIARGERADG